jgi:hypothetical protein
MVGNEYFRSVEEALEFAGDIHRLDSILMSLRSEMPVDAIFFHARSHGDYEHLFETVVSFYGICLARNIAINGGDGSHRDSNILGEAWPGGDFWKDKLLDYGIEEQRIHSTPTAYNTKQENDFFVSLAEKEGWRSAVIAAQPHELIRAYLGAVKSMADQKYLIRLSTLWPVSKTMPDWRRAIYAYSAMLTPEQILLIPEGSSRYRSRFDLVPEQITRLPEYIKKGDLATFQECYSYLDRMDLIH